MQNYIYVRKKNEETVYTLYKSIKKEKINTTELIKIDDFVNTGSGYIVVNDKIYKIVANIVCRIKTVQGRVNIIFCMDMEW